MSSLNYGPVPVTDPALGCPIVVAAGRVSPVQGQTQAPVYVSGWGTSFDEAAMNCFFEAEEAYHSQFIAAERLVRARADELFGRVVTPAELLPYRDDQYREPLAGDDGGGDRPLRWDEKKPLDWIRADASADAPAWLPARLCVSAYSGDAQSGLPEADSNGLATGKSVGDATIRGFLELVERDATAIWWYSGLVPPRLDPASLGDTLVRDYRDWSRGRGRELRLLRLSLDLAVPVVAAIAHRADGRFPAMGFAAGKTEAEAARRAVGELAQCEANLALLDRRADSAGTAGFTAAATRLHGWHRTAEVTRDPRLAGGDTVEISPLRLDVDRAGCRTICREHGLEMFVVDLTRPESGPVVRVMVPGLCSTKPRLGAERLRGVPHRLGLQALEQPEETPFPA